MDQSPKVNRHLVMPECQRDLSREREIKREPGICTTPSGSALRLIFTGPIWAGIFDPLNTFQGGLGRIRGIYYRRILSSTRLKKTGESLAL